VLSYIDSEQPDLIIASGDIAELPSQEAYARFFQSLEVFNCPIFSIPGNHDNSLLLANSSLQLGGWQFIGLDSNGPAIKKYGGFLAQSELEFLQSKLKQSSEPTVIVLHHPVLVPESNWLQEVKLENADEFVKIIEAHPQVKAVLSGHVHYTYEMRQSEVMYLSCPSTYRQFDGKAREFAIDKALSYGYRKLILEASGTIISSVHLMKESYEK
jgi:Icc protein